MLIPLKTKINSLSLLNLIDIFWIISHPLRIRGVIKISQTAREIIENFLTDSDLDGDLYGGQLDAMLHIIWAALLTQRYGKNFAQKVVNFYEQSYKTDFYRNIFENYLLPDSTNMILNFINCQLGFDIGSRYPKISIQSLVNLAKNIVLEGKAWIIKKDKSGNFLDLAGNIISKEQWIGKWNTPKVIVPSNFFKSQNNAI